MTPHENAESGASEVQHVTFALQAPGSLEFVCNDWQRGGWALLRIVPFTEFQAVAVFERRTPIDGSVSDA